MLNEDIKQAYEDVCPDEIARARMLEAILTKNKDQTEPVHTPTPVRVPKWLVGTIGAVAAVWLVMALPQPESPAEPAPEPDPRPMVQTIAPQPERPVVTAKAPAAEAPVLPDSLDWEGHSYALEKGTTIEDVELGGELAPHDGGAIRSLRNRDVCQAIALSTPNGNYLYQRPCDKNQGE